MPDVESPTSTLPSPTWRRAGRRRSGATSTGACSPTRSVDDDSPERYFAAAEAMTDRIIAVGEVADGTRVLDVGCGFGGTLDHLRARVAALRAGRAQHRRAPAAVGPPAASAGPGAAPPPFVAADGCRLPVAARSLDHVLAVECVFHFPSRRAFFREAARVLRPGRDAGAVRLPDGPGRAGPGGRDHGRVGRAGGGGLVRLRGQAADGGGLRAPGPQRRVRRAGGRRRHRGDAAHLSGAAPPGPGLGRARGPRHHRRRRGAGRRRRPPVPRAGVPPG